MLTINPKTEMISYFENPSSTFHKQYLAMRRYYYDGCTAEEVAKESGYTVSTVYSMARGFKENILKGGGDPYFKEDNKSGRKPIDRSGEVEEIVVNLRKKYFSVPDIQITLDALDIKLTVYAIEKIITDAGFARLPRRDKQFRKEVISSFEPGLIAPKSVRLTIGKCKGKEFLKDCNSRYSRSFIRSVGSQKRANSKGSEKSADHRGEFIFKIASLC